MSASLFIRSSKSRKNIRPVNDVSEEDINSLLRTIKEFDGYPKLRELGRMVPSLTALQVKVIVQYLERNGAIVIDSGGHIVWTRTERQQLTLGEVADFSKDLNEFLGRHGELSEPH